MIWAAMAFLLGVFVGYWIGTFKTVAEVNKAVDAVRRSYPLEVKERVSPAYVWSDKEDWPTTPELYDVFKEDQPDTEGD